MVFTPLKFKAFGFTIKDQLSQYGYQRGNIIFILFSFIIVLSYCTLIVF